jgi:recombination protein RecA
MAKRQKKTADEERAARVAQICSTINAGDWGGEDKNAVTWLGSRDTVPVQRWTSGCGVLDDALGGGWPKGRFIEFFGPEMGGKTTAALHAIAEHQKAFPGEDIGFIDSEYAFDEEYAQVIGVDTKYLIVNQPEHGKQALNVLEQLVKMGLGLMVVDSVAALTTKEELEGDIGDIQVGAQARMMSGALRRLNVEAGRRDTSIIWTNQVREKIGVKFGSPETTPAGRALRHYASLRVRFSRIGHIKEGDAIVSSKTKADVKKNKVAPPFRIAEFCITFGIGIDIVAALLDEAIALKLVEKRGSWLAFDGQQLGQGRPAVINMLRTDEERKALIAKAIADFKHKADTGEATINVTSTEKKEPESGGKKIKRPSGRTPVADPDAIDSPNSEVEVQNA